MSENRPQQQGRVTEQKQKERGTVKRDRQKISKHERYLEDETNKEGEPDLKQSVEKCLEERLKLQQAFSQKNFSFGSTAWSWNSKLNKHLVRFSRPCSKCQLL